MRYPLILLLFVFTTSVYSQDDILDELEGKKPTSEPAAEVTPKPKTGLTDAESEVTPGDPAEPPGNAEDASNADQDADQQAPDEQDAAEPEEAEIPSLLTWFDDVSRSGPLGLIREGGLFMWPILFLGVLAAGVIIERYRSLRLLETDSSALRTEVHDLLHADRVEDAYQLCENSQGPVPAVLSCGLRKFVVLRKLRYDAARTEEQVVKAMEDHSIHIVAALERHLPVLATISSVAPMLGFLGTVAGMITSFNDIEAMFEGANSGGQNIVQAAAGGISVALITTCFGLIIGIPAFMAYNYFTGIINRFVLDVEESTTELIEGVTLQLAVAGAAERDPHPAA